MLPGRWLNPGHGSSGWAPAFGGARALSDLTSGCPAEIDMQGPYISRLGCSSISKRTCPTAFVTELPWFDPTKPLK